MALPAVSIPSIPLPFQVPAEIHPCVIHLAVALPIVIVLMELVNLVIKKRTLGVFSFVLMILLAIVLFGAYLTGSVDAENAKSALTGDAKSLFDAHKLQGIYLVYGAAVLVVIKLLSVLVRKTAMRVIFLLFLIAFTALTVNTAKKGKELVFHYGINVKSAAPATAPAVAPAPKAETPAAVVEEKSEAPTPAAEEKKPAETEAPAAAEAMTEEKAEVSAETKAEKPEAEPAKTEAPASEEKPAATHEETAAEGMKEQVEHRAEKAESEAGASEAPAAPEAPAHQ